jgi:hypothetical protein
MQLHSTAGRGTGWTWTKDRGIVRIAYSLRVLYPFVKLPLIPFISSIWMILNPISRRPVFTLPPRFVRRVGVLFLTLCCHPACPERSRRERSEACLPLVRRGGQAGTSPCPLPLPFRVPHARFLSVGLFRRWFVGAPSFARAAPAAQVENGAKGGVLFCFTLSSRTQRAAVARWR